MGEAVVGTLVAHDLDPHAPRARRGRLPAARGRRCRRWRAPGRRRGGRARRAARPASGSATSRAPGPCRRRTPPGRTGPVPAAFSAYMPPMQNPTTATGSTSVASAAATASPSTRSSSSVPPAASLDSIVVRSSRPPHRSKAHTTQPFSSARRATWSSKSGRRLPMSGIRTRPRSAGPSGRAISAGVPDGSVMRTPQVYRAGAASAVAVEDARLGQAREPVLDGPGPGGADARSTSSRSSIVARMIFCSVPNRLDDAFDDRLGQAGDAGQQPVTPGLHVGVEVDRLARHLQGGGHGRGGRAAPRCPCPPARPSPRRPSSRPSAVK